MCIFRVLYAINRTAYPSLIRLSHVRRKRGELGHSSAIVHVDDSIDLFNLASSWQSMRSHRTLANVIVV